MARALLLVLLFGCGDGLEPPPDAGRDPAPIQYTLVDLWCGGGEQLGLIDEALARTPVARLGLQTPIPHRTELTYRYEGADCLAVERWVYFDREREARERLVIDCQPAGCRLDPDSEPCLVGLKPDRAPLEIGVDLVDGTHLFVDFGAGYPGMCASRGRDFESQTWRRL